jgi:hypothetical protein
LRNRRLASALAKEYRSGFELEAGFLEFAVGEEPDEGFVVEVDDLEAVAPRIAEVAAEAFDEFQSVLLREFVADGGELGFVADHDAEVLMAFDGIHVFALEQSEELVLAEFEEGVAFAFVEFLEAEDVFVEGDGLGDVADFEGDVVASVDLDFHVIRFLDRI